VSDSEADTKPHQEEEAFALTLKFSLLPISRKRLMRASERNGQSLVSEKGRKGGKRNKSFWDSLVTPAYLTNNMIFINWWWITKEKKSA